MSDQLPHPSDFDPMKLLDAYLDGQLSDNHRAHFEQTIAHDPALRELVDQQRQIDQSLATMFSAPTIPAALVRQLQQSRNGAQTKSGDGQAHKSNGDSIRIESHPRFDHRAV